MPPIVLSTLDATSCERNEKAEEESTTKVACDTPLLVRKHSSLIDRAESVSERTFPEELSDSTIEDCSESQLSDCEADQDRADEKMSSLLTMGEDAETLSKDNQDINIPSNVHQESSGDSHPSRQRTSILKRCVSDSLSISQSRRSWKRLPPVDVDAVQRRMSLFESGTEGAPSDRSSMSVSFKDVQIRAYDQCVGDNPSVSYGPPISLDWSYEEMQAIGIDEYEDARGQRRTLRQMILSYYHRRNVLSWQYGVSDEDLRHAKKQANKVKFERSVTQYFLPVMAVENVIESAGRKAKRLVKGSEKK